MPFVQLSEGGVPLVYRQSAAAVGRAHGFGAGQWIVPVYPRRAHVVPSRHAQVSEEAANEAEDAAAYRHGCC